MDLNEGLGKTKTTVRGSFPEMGEKLEVLVLEYDFAGTRTGTREVSTRTRTRTRKGPHSPTSVLENCVTRIFSHGHVIVTSHLVTVMEIFENWSRSRFITMRNT